MPDLLDHTRVSELFRGGGILTDQFNHLRMGEFPRAQNRPTPIFSGAIAATSSVSGLVAAQKLLHPATISATSSVSTIGVVLPRKGDKFDHTRMGEMFRSGGLLIDKFDHTRVNELARTINVSYSTGRNVVAATIQATSSASGVVGLKKNIPPSGISATSSISGSVSKGTAKAIAPASISATSSVSGYASEVHKLVVASIAATSVVSALVGRRRPLVPASVAATSTATVAVFGAARRIQASVISALSSVSGAVVRGGGVAGTVSATSVVSCVPGITKLGLFGDRFDHTRMAELFHGGGNATDRFDHTRMSEMAKYINLVLVPASKNIVPADAIIAFSVVSGLVRKPKRPVGGNVIATSVVSGSIAGIATPGDKFDHTRSGELFRGGGRVSEQFNHTNRGELVRWVNVSTALPTGPGAKIILGGVVSATSSVAATVTKTGKLTPSAINAPSVVSGAVSRRTGGLSGIVTATSLVGFSVGGTYGSGMYGDGIYGEGGNGNIPVLRRLLTSPILATSSVTGTGIGRGHFIFPNVVFSVAQVSAKVGRRHNFSGVISAPGTVVATLIWQRTVRGTISATSVVSAVISQGGGGVAVGQIHATSQVSSNISHIVVGFAAQVVAIARMSARVTRGVPVYPLTIIAVATVGGRVTRILIYDVSASGRVTPPQPAGHVRVRGKVLT